MNNKFMFICITFIFTGLLLGCGNSDLQQSDNNGMEGYNQEISDDDSSFFVKSEDNINFDSGEIVSDNETVDENTEDLTDYSDEQVNAIFLKAYSYYINNELESDVPEPQFFEIDSINDNTVNIHIYDYVDDHTATRNWYFIDMTTFKGTDILGNEIDLN